MSSINLNEKQMYYEERGQGFPILFGHSYLWDARMWEPTIEELSDAGHIINLEQPKMVSSILKQFLSKVIKS